MKLATSPIMVRSEMNCVIRRTVNVTPRAPSWGAWKRILRGIDFSKSVISERLGRDL